MSSATISNYCILREDVEEEWVLSGEESEDWLELDGHCDEDDEEDDGWRAPSWREPWTLRLRKLQEEFEFYSRCFHRRMIGALRTEDDKTADLSRQVSDKVTVESRDDISLSRHRKRLMAESWACRLFTSSPVDDLFVEPLLGRSQLLLFNHLFRCPSDQWETYQAIIDYDWKEEGARRIAKKASRDCRRKRGKKGKNSKKTQNKTKEITPPVKVVSTAAGKSCAFDMERNDHDGNDEVHAELCSLESLRGSEDRKSCLLTEQVSLESESGSFIDEKSNTCFDKQPSTFECQNSLLVPALNA